MTVYVNGTGETKYGKLPERSVHDLVSEAGEAALAEAEIDRSEIDAIYVGNFAQVASCLDKAI